MRITKSIQLKRLFNGFIASLLIPSSAYAGLSKWKDEKGQVHYGDRVPSEYLRKEHSLLNEQGVTVDTSEAMKTEEELSQEEARRKIERAENLKRIIVVRKQALRDRVLLDTFTSESDLTLARDARIEAIDSQISLAKTLITNDEQKLADVKGRIASLIKAGRKAPENLHKKVELVGRQIENNYIYVADKHKERKEILKTFEQDVLRFRELKAERLKKKEEMGK